MTFFDSLKKWFYTKNSSAASSDARVPLLDASGNPKGSDTMANLASVLGGAFKNRSNTNGLVPYLGNIRVANKEQLDALTFASDTYGFYKFTGYNSGLVEADDGLLLVCYNFMLKYGADGKMAFRTMSSTTWHYVGYDIPSFYKDYSTLAALASAVISNVEIKQGYVAAGESKTISGGVSGILIIGTRYDGAAIYNLLYDSFSKIGGANHDAKITRPNYSLTLSGECSYFIFSTYRTDS